MKAVLAGLVLLVDALAAGLCWLSVGQQDYLAAGYFLGVLAMTIHPEAQRSAGWCDRRCGLATGSRAAAMLARVPHGEAVTRAAYRQQLVAERLTRVPYQGSYVSAAMVRGFQQEPAAVRAYEIATGARVRRTGFLQHDTLAAGCSIDGDVDGFTGILEVKNPNTATHVDYLRAGVLPRAHLAQVTHNLWLTRAAWCDFVSFDDRCGPSTRLFVVRVHAADLDLASYARKCTTFLNEVAAATRAWSDLLGGTVPTPTREPRVFVGTPAAIATHAVPWDAPGTRLATARCGRYVDRTREHAAAPSCAACAQAIAAEEALDI